MALAPPSISRNHDKMIQVTPHLALADNEIQFKFIRASGPGGQNVNKVATAVQLRFDVDHSRSLPADVRARLLALAGNRVSSNNVLIIDARRFRTQERNRQDAIARLVALIRKAAEKPKLRRKTKPTHASKKRRLETKLRRGDAKRGRGAVRYSEE